VKLLQGIPRLLHSDEEESSKLPISTGPGPSWFGIGISDAMWRVFVFSSLMRHMRFFLTRLMVAREFCSRHVL
jgi:hypothetical protein